MDAVRSQTYHNFCFPSIFGDEILTDATSELLKSLVRNCCEFEQNFTSIDRKVRREGLFKYFDFELSEALNNFSLEEDLGCTCSVFSSDVDSSFASL